MAGNINPNPFTTRPEIDGTFGVVTSTHWIATAVGMGTLERGGNAFDAAVATAFTLQVVEPHLNGPGGDVPVLLYDVRKGKPELICGQGPAPAGATIAQIEKARKVWSQGFVAAAIDKFCRTQAVMDTSGSPHKGVLTGEDMAKWRALIEAPLTYDYGRYTVCKPPWSQGPVTLQQLALLKGFNLDGLDVVG